MVVDNRHLPECAHQVPHEQPGLVLLGSYCPGDNDFGFDSGPGSVAGCEKGEHECSGDGHGNWCCCSLQLREDMPWHTPHG